MSCLDSRRQTTKHKLWYFTLIHSWDWHVPSHMYEGQNGGLKKNCGDLEVSMFGFNGENDSFKMWIDLGK